MSAFYDAGTYQVRIVDHTIEMSANGNPMITAVGEVLAQKSGGEIYDLDTNYQRTARITVVSNNAKSAEFAAKRLAHAGHTGSMASLNLRGKVVEWECKHEEYNGEEGEKWEFALPPKRPELAAQDANAARTLDAMLGNYLKQQPKPLQPPASGNMPQPPASLEPGQNGLKQLPDGFEDPFA